jgi:hypothetical protein
MTDEQAEKLRAQLARVGRIARRGSTESGVFRRKVALNPQAILSAMVPIFPAAFVKTAALGSDLRPATRFR